MSDNNKEIIPCLWYNDVADEAVEFYKSVFGNVEVKHTDHYTEAGKEDHGHQAGTVVTIDFSIYGKNFIALNGGPYFKFTPATSFFVNCESVDEVKELAAKLSEDAEILMALGEYPFSKQYVWLNDKFGLSWQIIFKENAQKEKIIPSLMFSGDKSGKAKEAVSFYTSVFEDSRVGDISEYDEESAPTPDAIGKIAYGEFILQGNTFAIMDSPMQHEFTTTPAVSFTVTCETQEEIDYYWGKLSAVPKAEQCGWLEDKYGISWQIVPNALNTMLRQGSTQQREQVTAAYMQMKKFDIAALEEVFAQSK